MEALGRTATEASGITALAVGVSFIVTGAYIPGLVTFVLGIVLIGVYEMFGIENIGLSKEQIEGVGENTEEVIDDFTDE